MIKISYTLSMKYELEPSNILDRLATIRNAVLDMPVKSVTELNTVILEATDRHRFGNKEYVPLFRTGFRCFFWQGTSILDLYLRKFPDEGRCPRFITGSGEFWSDSGMYIEDKSTKRIGEHEFVSRHRTAIAILETCRNVGINVEIKDESGYADTHNPLSLLAFKRQMDKIVDPREILG